MQQACLFRGTEPELRTRHHARPTLGDPACFSRGSRRGSGPFLARFRLKPLALGSGCRGGPCHVFVRASCAAGGVSEDASQRGEGASTGQLAASIPRPPEWPNPRESSPFFCSRRGGDPGMAKPCARPRRRRSRRTLPGGKSSDPPLFSGKSQRWRAFHPTPAGAPRPTSRRSVRSRGSFNQPWISPFPCPVGPRRVPGRLPPIQALK